MSFSKTQDFRVCENAAAFYLGGGSTVANPGNAIFRNTLDARIGNLERSATSSDIVK
jgi:hypothetical protein